MRPTRRFVPVRFLASYLRVGKARSVGWNRRAPEASERWDVLSNAPWGSRSACNVQKNCSFFFSSSSFEGWVRIYRIEEGPERSKLKRIAGKLPSNVHRIFRISDPCSSTSNENCCGRFDFYLIKFALILRNYIALEEGAGPTFLVSESLSVNPDPTPKK